MTADVDDREFDLILWGATGFTGCLVAHYLAGHPGIDDVRWALGGRNRTKLESLRDELGLSDDELPLVVGDCLDREGLDEIVSRTRVICSTVGPYARYGGPLVAACIEGGTDYCDLTGEVQWIREMIDKHHDQALARQVRIVHCCGIDSIPSDLGVLVLQEEAKERFGVPAERVRFLLWKARGGISGGTVASMAELLEKAAEDREIRKILANPYSLNPRGEQFGPDGSFQQLPRREREIDVWTAPFVMAAINEKIVRRTNALLGYPYGENFSYSEATHLGKGAPAAVRATLMSAGLGAFSAAMSVGPTRKLLQRFLLPDPGEGPSKETIENGFFKIRLFGSGRDEDGRDFSLSVRVGADSDPGYGATAIMLGNAALSLAFDDAPQAMIGGVLTPASALGRPLIDRLQEAGMVLEAE